MLGLCCDRIYHCISSNGDFLSRNMGNFSTIQSCVQKLLKINFKSQQSPGNALVIGVSGRQIFKYVFNPFQTNGPFLNLLKMFIPPFKWCKIGTLAGNGLVYQRQMFSSHVMLCAIWYHFYNFKNVKNTNRGVYFITSLRASACNFTKNNTPSWAFFMFLKSYKWYQIAQSTSYRKK